MINYRIAQHEGQGGSEIFGFTTLYFYFVFVICKLGLLVNQPFVQAVFIPSYFCCTGYYNEKQKAHGPSSGLTQWNRQTLIK